MIWPYANKILRFHSQTISVCSSISTTLETSQCASSFAYMDCSCSVPICSCITFRLLKSENNRTVGSLARTNIPYTWRVVFSPCERKDSLFISLLSTSSIGPTYTPVWNYVHEEFNDANIPCLEFSMLSYNKWTQTLNVTKFVSFAKQLKIKGEF